MAATARHPDLMPFVTQLTIPVLVVTGEHDPNLVSSRRALDHAAREFTDLGASARFGTRAAALRDRIAQFRVEASGE